MISSFESSIFKNFSFIVFLSEFSMFEVSHSQNVSGTSYVPVRTYWKRRRFRKDSKESFDIVSTAPERSPSFRIGCTRIVPNSCSVRRDRCIRNKKLLLSTNVSAVPRRSVSDDPSPSLLGPSSAVLLARPTNLAAARGNCGYRQIMPGPQLLCRQISAASTASRFSVYGRDSHRLRLASFSRCRERAFASPRAAGSSQKTTRYA